MSPSTHFIGYGSRFLSQKGLADHFSRTCWGKRTTNLRDLEQDISHWVTTGALEPFNDGDETARSQAVFRYWQVYELETIRRERSIIVDKEDRSRGIPYCDSTINTWYSLRPKHFMKYREFFETVGVYAEALIDDNKQSAASQEKFALESMGGKSEQQWRDFLHDLCLLWRDYYRHGQVGIRNHLRNDIERLLDLLQQKYALTFQALDEEIGKGRFNYCEPFYNSLLTWVRDGDLYAQQADTAFSLFSNRSAYDRLATGSGGIVTEDCEQIAQYARNEDQITLLHACSWIKNSDNKTLGGGYYYSEAIRCLRELSISSETLLDTVATEYNIQTRACTGIYQKLRTVFGKENDRAAWWKEFESTHEQMKNGNDSNFASFLAKQSSGLTGVGQALAFSCKMRNEVTHSSTGYRELFRAGYSILLDSAFVTLFCIWFWARDRGITEKILDRNR